MEIRGLQVAPVERWQLEIHPHAPGQQLPLLSRAPRAQDTMEHVPRMPTIRNALVSSHRPVRLSRHRRGGVGDADFGIIYNRISREIGFPGIPAALAESPRGGAPRGCVLRVGPEWDPSRHGGLDKECLNAPVTSDPKRHGHDTTGFAVWRHRFRGWGS